jgi:hypothetical protein
MNIKMICAIVASSMLVACGEQSEAIKVTSDFWEGLSTNNKPLLESVLEKKKDAEFLSSGKSTLSGYEVLGEVSNGVEVKFSTFCYPDIIIPTVLKDVNGTKKVDFRATLKAQMTARKNAVALRKYCYEFEDKPLSGSLDGMPWAFNKTVSREINWGNEISINTTLYSENCDTKTYGECKKSSLIISNLDLNSEGGNFTNKVNVTVHVPPSDNHVITEGSYRVTTINNNKKVELSFNKDEFNNISGYYFIQ